LVGLDGTNLHIRRLTEDHSLAALSLVAHITGEPAAISRLIAKSPQLQMGIDDSFGTATTCHLKSASQAILDVRGHIDREKGRGLSRTTSQAVSMPEVPGNDLERTIAGIWREVLGLEQLSVTDNFFDLGGSSLTMGQANGRIEETLKRKISMTETFQYSTVRTLAAYLSGANKAGNAPDLSNSQSRGERRREMARGRRR
jgi:acyl carrier protein